jgi:hypothetical protein
MALTCDAIRLMLRSMPTLSDDDQKVVWEHICGHDGCKREFLAVIQTHLRAANPQPTPAPPAPARTPNLYERVRAKRDEFLQRRGSP